MKITFIVTDEEPHKEIIKDMPTAPSVDDFVTLDNHTLYHITNVIHHFDFESANGYEVTCGLKKVVR